MAPGFWVEGGTWKNISYMNSSQVLYCNGVSRISVGGTFSIIVLLKGFCKFLKIYKTFAQNLKNCPKFVKK